MEDPRWLEDTQRWAKREGLTVEYTTDHKYPVVIKRPCHDGDAFLARMQTVTEARCWLSGYRYGIEAQRTGCATSGV